ncbi:hypothetical protein Sta7437_4533 (plasmid) [Stanieria cyanosphaera PCC 7437]|uniref:Uncharacterized protein n=1 Tax=Stanieria cyanosphaera (strain ATCC 29371 / PCC 7437) TaxID=111780 RepID=K9XZH3_STAC7|nr:hypothetical protein [Stanieria cyanosphaera]AFZ37995.1 hypothetical protein Sta7437_4533 [Stanieria cyanosphaera PCC 7437]
MQTRLDLPPASKQNKIATQKPVNSLMKYLKIRPSDLPYAVGVTAGVVYLAINDAFFVFVLASFALVFGAMYYCAKVIPFLEKTIGHRISIWHVGVLVLGLTMVVGMLEPANALFLQDLENRVTDVIGGTSSGLPPESVALIFNFLRVAFVLFVVAAGIFAFIQAQQGNDPRPIIGTIVIAFGTIMGIDVLTVLIAGAGA